MNNKASNKEAKNEMKFSIYINDFKFNFQHY